jgi:4'-phosphopantetheinyl transferase
MRARVDVWLRLGGSDPAALAVAAAAALLGEPAGRLAVIREPGGRPRIAGAKARVDISLSRGPEMAAAAVSTAGPVGVDVERLRPVGGACAVAGRWFPPDEAAWLAGQPAERQAAAFLGLWTQKEAIAKALGTGLRGGAGLRRGVARVLAEPCRSGQQLALIGPPGLAVGVATVADLAVLAVACLGRSASGAVTVRVAVR